MSYSSQADLLQEVESAALVNLTDDTGTGIADAAKVTRAIADADSEIDSYVGVQVSIPLDPVPDVIRKVSVTIAIYNLYSRRQLAVETVTERYKSAISWLRDVAAGKASLGDEDYSASPVEVMVAAANPTRLFTRATLKDA